MKLEMELEKELKWEQKVDVKKDVKTLEILFLGQAVTQGEGEDGGGQGCGLPQRQGGVLEADRIETTPMALPAQKYV